MHLPSNFESLLRLGAGTILWAISGILTGALFINFARSDPVKQSVLLCLAIGLEGAKLLTWRMGGRYRILAIALIALSVFASLGAALETVEATRTSSNTAKIVPTAPDTTDIDQHIKILLARLEALPPDYRSAANDINQEIGILREQRSTSIAQWNQTSVIQQKKAAPRTMFDMIAQALGLPVDGVMLVTLLFMAACLEVSALVLAGTAQTHSCPVEPSIAGTNTTQPTVSSEEFLAAASEGSPLPLLHGRETTARRLGIGSYAAKQHVRRLVKMGLIKVQGKRLTLVYPPQEENT